MAYKSMGFITKFEKEFLIFHVTRSNTNSILNLCMESEGEFNRIIPSNTNNAFLSSLKDSSIEFRISNNCIGLDCLITAEFIHLEDDISSDNQTQTMKDVWYEEKFIQRNRNEKFK